MLFKFAVIDRLVLSKLRAALGGRVQYAVSGSAPLGLHLGHFFRSVGVSILEGYGLTETTSAAYLNPQVGFRFGTVGRSLDVVETRIAEDGEILMRGPSVFRQYYNNPQATAESVEPDGWFHSGDIGQLEDGFLRVDSIDAVSETDERDVVSIPPSAATVGDLCTATVRRLKPDVPAEMYGIAAVREGAVERYLKAGRWLHRRRAEVTMAFPSDPNGNLLTRVVIFGDSL